MSSDVLMMLVRLKAAAGGIPLKQSDIDDIIVKYGSVIECERLKVQKASEQFEEFVIKIARMYREPEPSPLARMLKR